MTLDKVTSTMLEAEIDDCQSANDVKKVLHKYKDYELKGVHLGKAFEKMFVKDEGFSASIKMKDLIVLHKSFLTTNGSTWCRTSQSYLGKKYNIERKLEKGRIAQVKTDGFNKSLTINQAIRGDILKNVQSRRCAILDISTNIECDHKDGMKDDWRLNDKSKQSPDDFQPLCKTANDSKRQHCKACKETGIRYDATKMGYSKPYIFGTEKSSTCVGCYWYDPVKFNQVISKDFNKSDDT